MYNFLRSPRWLGGHVLALAGVVLFVVAGFWQLSRLEEVRGYNRTVSARLAEPERLLAEILDEVGTDPDALAYRRATVTGDFLPDEEVLLSTRSFRGNPGHHLLTPLATGGGAGVIVDRGWIPLPLDEPPVAEAAPTAGSGEVTVRGILFPPEQRTPFTPEPGAGDADFLRLVDLGRLQRQVSVDLAPVYLLAQAQRPAPPGPLPAMAEMPPLDEGNHQSYAVQWFLFAAVVLVGYPLLLRRTARERAITAEPAREPARVP